MANEGNGTNFITLYSTKAHVFQINDTKSSWIQKGDHAIPISIVASITPSTNETLSKQQLRLIGTDDDKNTVLNAPIMPTTVFTKRSQKFGQWIDQTGTLHGLGFNSQEELKEFMEAFQQSQTDTFELPSSYPPMEQHQQAHRMQHHQQPQQQPSTSFANSQDQPDKAEMSWNQHQQSINDASEINGLSHKTGRYNPSMTNNNNNMTNKQFNSNTLAHPGHQMKRQQQQLHSQQPQHMLHQQHQILSQNSLNSNITTTTSKTNGNISLNNGVSMENGGSNNVSAYPRSQSMFGLQGKPINNNNQKPDIVSLRSGGGAGTPDTENSTCIIQNNDWQLKEQLKYENERLKQALEESSRNAGIWHNELITLRTNNVKLTQALEESKSNVEEWEKELTGLTNENKELKMRISALESMNDAEKGSEYQRYKNYIEEIQSELGKKENKIEELQKSMELLELKTKQQNGHDDSNSSSQFANNSIQRQKLEVISAKFGAKISELVNVQKEFGQYLDKLNN